MAILLVSVAGATGASDGRFVLRGKVATVVDGDTLIVHLASGKRERVRLIGVDTPESGNCFAATATARARALAQGKQVVLIGDPTQATRDRYRRLLAYVWLPRGKDLGYHLVAGGFAKVYVFSRPFQRLHVYRRAQSTAIQRGRGLWQSCGPRQPPPPPPPSSPPPPPGGNCDRQSYPTVCIPAYPPDLDCPDVPYTNFTVRPPDPHGFDGDGDGVGCET